MDILPWHPDFSENPGLQPDLQRPVFLLHTSVAILQLHIDLQFSPKRPSLHSEINNTFCS